MRTVVVLPAAVRPKQAEYLALADRQVDGVDGGKTIKTTAQAACLYH